MLPFAEYISKSCLIFMVLFCSLNGFGDFSGEEQMNLRLGFDLSQGENGSPSLRIRDFEDSSELKVRADDGDVVKIKKSPAVRADDSFSDSSDSKSTDNAKVRIDDSSKENANVNEDSDESDEDMGNRYSTKGLNLREYEPEENPKVHKKYRDSDSESDSPHRRFQRGI